MAKYEVYKGFQDEFKLIAVAENYTAAMDIKEALEAQQPDGGDNAVSESVWVKEKSEEITFKGQRMVFDTQGTTNVASLGILGTASSDAPYGFYPPTLTVKKVETYEDNSTAVKPQVNNIIAAKIKAVEKATEQLRQETQSSLLKELERQGLLERTARAKEASQLTVPMDYRKNPSSERAVGTKKNG